MLQTLPITPPAVVERPAAPPPPGEPSPGGFADALRDAAGAREADATPAEGDLPPARAAADAQGQAARERHDLAEVSRARHDRAASEGTDARAAAPVRAEGPTQAIDATSDVRLMRSERGEDEVDGAAPAGADAPAAAVAPSPLPAWITASLPPSAQGSAAVDTPPLADAGAARHPAAAAASRLASQRSAHGPAQNIERPRDEAARPDVTVPFAPETPSDTPRAAAIGAAPAATSRPGANPDALATPALPSALVVPGAVSPAAGDATRADLATATLRDPLGSRGFAQQLGQQLGVWVRDGVQEARLHLHPAELGPVAISITLDGHAAQVDFHAAHARTREAIEASLPALALALREGGFTLAGGGVFGQSAGNGHAGDRAAASPPPARDESPGAPSSATAGPLPGRPAAWRRGLLDVFA